MSRQYDSTYKDKDAVILENARLKVVLLPECGGKLQSIWDKQEGKELLVQNSSERYRESRYDSPYVEGDVSGFDEIFPSIETCFYPVYPWRGIRVPDHGEVWSLPWSYPTKDESGKLFMQCSGVRFPYRLVKRIEFVQESAIKITYEAYNSSPFEFPCIWAPHGLWLCEEDTRIILPPSIDSIMSTCSVPNRLGFFGSIHSWPSASISGEQYEIDRVYSKYPNKCEKYYARGDIKEGWCALRNDKSGYTIGLAYPIEKVPYLGVWEGIMQGRYVTALEPCTGALDALDTAIQWHQVQTIPPHSHTEWYLTISIGTTSGVQSIDENGNFNEGATA